MKKDALLKRCKLLEAALRPFADLPARDSQGSPVIDIHVSYSGGSGWSMKVASRVDARLALKRAHKAIGGQ